MKNSFWSVSAIRDTSRTTLGLSKVRSTRSPDRGFAIHPRLSTNRPSRFFTRGALCASSWKCRGWKENKRSTDNGFGSRLCWWRCIVARHCCGPVIVSLFCDRSQGGVPRVREPRPRSLGTFAIIRKNDRSAIKPASKGASPSPFSSFPVRANQEGKEGGGSRSRS